MKLHQLAAGAAVALLATAAVADPVTNLSDGLGALNRHDEDVAVRLLTKSLDSRMLSAANEELALVKRAEAYLLVGRDGEALADAERALAMQPGDVEAQRVRNYAAKVDRPPPHGPTFNNDRLLNASVSARNTAVNAELAASDAAYQSALADFEAKKRTAAAAYAAQMAAYNASVAQAAAAHAAWEAAVAACKAGDRAKCARP